MLEIQHASRLHSVKLDGSLQAEGELQTVCWVELERASSADPSPLCRNGSYSFHSPPVLLPWLKQDWPFLANT